MPALAAPASREGTMMEYFGMFLEAIGAAVVLFFAALIVLGRIIEWQRLR